VATILIIEDSASQRAEVRGLLHRSGLFDQILEADNGLRGLKLLLSEPVDLVVCDLELPGLDGEKLLRMSHSAHGRDIPFLVLTSHKAPTGSRSSSATAPATPSRSPSARPT
jgi:CheY-like chemotaxis protein